MADKINTFRLLVNIGFTTYEVTVRRGFVSSQNTFVLSGSRSERKLTSPTPFLMVPTAVIFFLVVTLPVPNMYEIGQGRGFSLAEWKLCPSYEPEFQRILLCWLRNKDLGSSVFQHMLWQHKCEKSKH